MPKETKLFKKTYSNGKTMKIAIASDHAGFNYKQEIIRYLEDKNYTLINFGTASAESVDYPDYIKPAAIAVAKGNCDLGIVLGGSGNGEAIAANKIKGIRCAVVWNQESAQLAKEHNNANMISIGERMMPLSEVLKAIDLWLSTQFEGGRHTRRIEKIEQDYA